MRAGLLLVLAGCATAAPAAPAPPTLAELYRKAEKHGEEARAKAFKLTIAPQWIDGGPRFWYRNDVRGAKEFVVVDPEKGTRTVVPEAPSAAAPARRRPELVRTSPSRSPDGRRSVEFRDFNAFLVEGDARHALTRDGEEKHPYGGPVRWSPDSRRFVIFRTRPGDARQVHYVESSPKDQVQPKHSTRTYDKPGDALPLPRPRLFEAETGREVPLDDALWAGAYDLSPFSPRDIRWSADGRRFTFPYLQRGHQLARVIEVDAETRAARALIEERTDTFIDIHKSWMHFVGDAEILRMSERDGWNHLYLHDAATGAVKAQVTRGEWVLRRVERVDDAKRQIWFRGSGRNPGEDPYHVHVYRVNYDGTGLTALTEGDGTHNVQFSPDGGYLVDTWSRADKAPVHELRRATDGSLVLRLEEAVIGDLRLPEVFHAQGRDGQTDIWGLIHRPADFDPAKKYPVVESIYAGPQDSHVPKAFATGGSAAALAQLGFIVVQIDGMGTSNRSRAFHHFCWRNLKDAGLPDRIAWMKAAAAKYPQMDLARVGVYGHSAGAQNALGALLFHGDFYKAGVASCGCHDNRMDKVWWNEQWMGYPVGPHYAENSNVTHAAKLKGKLLLIVGELDTNVDPASTMQVVNALVRAKKDFELLVVPGAGHGGGGDYDRRRRWDFFVRHLQGREPPDWNGGNP